VVITTIALRSDLESDLQRLLIDVGAINANDYRIKKKREADALEHISRDLKPSKVQSDDDDSDDWD
jgi:hypothetical protein